MTYTQTTLKKIIEKALIDAGKTKGELASELGITPQALSARLRNGKFSYDEMLKIANFLECTFYCGFEPMQQSEAQAKLHR